MSINPHTYDVEDDGCTPEEVDLGCQDAAPLHVTVEADLPAGYGPVVRTYFLQEWMDIDTFLTPVILDTLRWFQGDGLHQGTPWFCFSAQQRARQENGEALSKREEANARKRWTVMINQAIRAFELMQAEHDGTRTLEDRAQYEAEERDIYKGLKVFAKIYRALWE